MIAILNKCQCSPGVKIDGGCIHCNPVDYAVNLECENEELLDEVAKLQEELDELEYDSDAEIDKLQLKIDRITDSFNLLLREFKADELKSDPLSGALENLKHEIEL